VGFLSRLRNVCGARSATAVALHAGRTLHVVGESYRQDALASVARSATNVEPYLAELKGGARRAAGNPSRLWFRAVLFREPDNPHDPNAIAVHADGKGLIGYLDRQSAIDYRPVFDELARRGEKYAGCPAYLTGGADMTWGAVLCISSPEAVLGDLRATEGD
jgi:hypothetical protein